MANNRMLVDERQRDIGNFMVGRLLPFRKKRQVGPFTFIDHMGPATLGDSGHYADVDQHPHIGLSTLTYLLEGAIEHKDSMGNEVVIAPGDVAFMTAGEGVTHTERTPQYQRTGEPITMHGYQIWVALPYEKELMEPEFEFYKADEIPKWREGELEIKLCAGSAFGKKAPIKGHSPLFMLDVKCEKASSLELKGKISGEVAVVIVNGKIRECEEEFSVGQMLISKADEQCSLHLLENSRVLIFGGQSLEREPLLMWNFVSADKTRLEQAREEWKEKRFPKVAGDDTYIPFPGE